jgi:hypothetical protein
LAKSADFCGISGSSSEGLGQTKDPVGRAALNPPRNTDSAACKGLQALAEAVGQALVRLEVTGNYCDPKVTTTALPAIGQTLGILGTRPAT